MRLRVPFLAALAVLVGLPGCAHRQARPGGSYISIFITSESDTTGLARAARAVRERRGIEPVLWLETNGHAWLAPDPLTDGAAHARLLEAAGVDAVLLTPDLVPLGPDRLRSLADNARFYLLAANVADSGGGICGQPFMVRRLAGLDVGLVGACPDGSRLVPRSMRIEPAAIAARRALVLLRQRADLVGLLSAATGGAETDDTALAFVAGRRSAGVPWVSPAEGNDRLCVMRIKLSGTEVEQARVETLALDAAARDSAVSAALDSIGRATDSLASLSVTVLKRDMAGAVLARLAAQAAVRALGCDCFIYDSALVTGGFKAGPLSRGRVIAAIGQPGRAALVDIPGEQLRTLAADKAVSVEWRPGLGSKTTSPGRSYRAAVTLDFLGRRLPGDATAFDLSRQQFWTIAADALQSTGQP